MNATDKPYAPACECHRAPILAAARPHFTDRRQVLEIGSGTGQHAVHFAAALPHLTWQSPDRPQNLAGICLWLAEARLPNTPPPRALDVSHPTLKGGASSPRARTGPHWPWLTLRLAHLAMQGEACARLVVYGPWPRQRFDTVFSTNTLHILAWPEVERMVAGLATVLSETARLASDGPFNHGGRHTSESNVQFDRRLKTGEARRGIRDFDAVHALAVGIGLTLLEEGPCRPTTAASFGSARAGWAHMPVELLSNAGELPVADWQALETADDPFVSRAFLGLAEATGAAGEDLGWRPMHCVLRDEAGRIEGFLPLYLRHHSFGDFSHDWQWAAAWRQAGLAYYPKLVSGVPYTPSPGPRLLCRQGAAAAVAANLIEIAIERVRETGASAWQCLYAREADVEPLRAVGLILRRGVQFHWLNRGYRDFTDFLDTLTADRRKKIRREQRAVAEAGLRVEIRHGDTLDADLWTAVHGHYRDTFLRHGNHPAFSVEFFRRVGQALGPRMVVFLAWQGDRPAASAICYRNETTLFGRHWGTALNCPGLHFDLCYYRGIEYAIAQGLQRFEPGAGGEHKLARGFEPVSTWSAFWIEDRRMRELLAQYLAREDEAMQDWQAELAQHLPYKVAEPLRTDGL